MDKVLADFITLNMLQRNCHLVWLIKLNIEGSSSRNFRD